MKFNGRIWLLTLAVGLILAGLSSAASADTVAITIQKWTTNFAALTSSSGAMIADETDLSVQTAGSSIIWGSGSASNPFWTGSVSALDITVIFGLDSASTGSSDLDSNVDVNKHSSSDTASYWLKVFVEKANPSPASPGFPYPSGSPLSATTTYGQTTGLGATGTMSSLIKDSANSSGLGSASIPNGSIVTGSNSLTRTDAQYDVKQEYDIKLDGTKNGHAEVHMSTHTVPEPLTILSALIGLVPMGLMVRSFRRRKSDD